MDPRNLVFTYLPIHVYRARSCHACVRCLYFREQLLIDALNDHCPNFARCTTAQNRMRKVPFPRAPRQGKITIFLANSLETLPSIGLGDRESRVPILATILVHARVPIHARAALKPVATVIFPFAWLATRR